MSFTDIMSMYYGLEAKKRDDELKSKLRKALLAGAARMHLRSRGKEESDDTVEEMVSNALSAINEGKYKLPELPGFALEDIDEANRQLRRYQASICVVYEDLGYGSYMTGGPAEAENTQHTD